MSHRTRIEPSRRRRGNAAMITALSLGALISFSAIAIDISYLRVIDVQLAQSVDAAVLAGSGYLDGTMDGLLDAKTGAVDFGNDNWVMGMGVDDTMFVDADVIFGAVSVADGVYTFEELAEHEDNMALINAVRITKDHSSIAALLSSAAFGEGTLASSATATAVRPFNWGATAVDCFLPIALPDCNFDPDAEVNGPAMFVSGAAALGDNVGWANVGNVSGKTVRTQLGGVCENGEIAVADVMSLQNGMITKAVAEMGDYLADGTGSTEPWPVNLEEPFVQPNQGDALTITGEYPSPSLVNNAGEAMVNIIGGPIAIVDMEGEPGSVCGEDGGDWNAPTEILGFTYGFIYDVVKDGNFKGMYVQMDFVNLYDMATEVGPTALGNIIDADAPPFLMP